MSKTQIAVLGIYRMAVTDELVRAQCDLLYGHAASGTARAKAERECREQLSSVVLVEVVVREPDKRFDVGHFTQPQDGVPKDSWQVAWAEAYLTPDGQELAVPRWSTPKGDADLRVAFYLHWWQPEAPLLSSCGEIRCPPVEEMPGRLARLVPYEPLD